MRVLITGGSGFVGKSLVEGLKDNFEVLTPRRQELDLLDEKSVEKYISKNKVTVVIHAAVHSALATSREFGFQQDMRMFVNILRNIEQLDKVISFGSGAEFAKTREIKKVSEDQFGEFVPEDSYGLSKYLFNELAQREPKLLNLRLFGIYGKHEDYRYKFITNSIVKHILEMPLRINQDVVFDYLYVDDLVKVVGYFLTHDSKHSDYNITPTGSVRLSQIVALIDEAGGRKSALEIINPGYNFEYSGDNSRLLKEIPDLDFTSVEDGIKQLYQYYQENIGDLDVEAVKKDDFLARLKIKK